MSQNVRLNRRLVGMLFAPLPALLLLFGLLTAQVSGAPPAHDTPDAPGSLSGVVTNEGGEPLANITVQMYAYGDQREQVRGETRTDAGGAYIFQGLGTGVYYLYFADPSNVYGFQYYENAGDLRSATGVPVAGRAVTGIDVTLAVGGKITGVLSFPEAGEGEFYANLSLLQDTGDEYLRSVDSIEIPTLPYTYTFDGLGATRYILCSSANTRDLYAFECYDNAANVEDAAQINLTTSEVRANVDIALGDGADLGTLSGRVTDLTNTPLADIGVGVLPYEVYESNPGEPYYHSGVRTALDGTFVLTNVIPGAYALFYIDIEERYLPSYYTGDSDEGAQRIVLPRFGSVSGLDQALHRAAWITGTITLRDGYPVTGGHVYVSSQSGSDYGPNPQPETYAGISATGHYTATGLYPGAYFVTAYARHYGDEFVGFYSPDGTEPQSVSVTYGEVKTGIDIEVGPGEYDGVLSGRVTHNDAPLAAIRVEVLDQGPENSPRAESVTSGPRQQPAANAEITEPAAIDSAIFYTMTNASGSYTVEGLLANKYYGVRFSDPAGVYATQCSSNPTSPYSCELRYMDMISNTLTFTATLPKAGRIVGLVGLPPGENSEDYRVYSYWIGPGDDFTWWPTQAIVATLDENGRYELPGLHGGIYRVALLRFNSHWNYYQLVEVYPNRTQLYLGQNIQVRAEQTVSGINFFLQLTERQYLPIITGQ